MQYVISYITATRQLQVLKVFGEANKNSAVELLERQEFTYVVTEID